MMAVNNIAIVIAPKKSITEIPVHVDWGIKSVINFLSQ